MQVSCRSEKTSEKVHEEKSSILHHHVYFDLNEDIESSELDEFTSIVDSLELIPKVQGFTHGAYEDLKDPRALNAYDYCLSMSFKNKIDYEVYQKHKIHLSVIKALSKFLKGPPATFDYKPRTPLNHEKQ